MRTVKSGDASRVLFSNHHRLVLELLLLNPDVGIHVRELARRTGMSAGSLHRELRALTESGLLVREPFGNQIRYRMNRSHPAFAGLASIFTAGDAQPSHSQAKRLAVQTRGHQRLDARSLALHAVAAGKLLASPTLVTGKVLPNLQRFKEIHAGTGVLPLLDAWERAARAGVNELVRLCVDPSDRGQQLRQASPIAGLLRESERRSIYETFAA